MALRLISCLGILIAVACFLVATSLYPGGYDWSRDYFSTLLRGAPSPARLFAIVGLLVFCTSIALVFERLARAAKCFRTSKVIQIGGIGSMVYAALTITPMHDLMVTISLAFFVIAVLALLRALYVSREIGFLVTGSVCLVLLVVSAAIYYSGHYVFALPLAQRASFALFAAWLVSLDFGAPRLGLGKIEPA